MLEHKPFVFLSAIVLVLVVVLALGALRLVNAQGEQPPTGQSVTATSGPNLLANPGFGDAGFYFRWPNSLVADYWYRYWYDDHDIPEFIDGGSVYHNACYPPPAPGQMCRDTSNNSQGYIRYGGSYIAGVWQPVRVTACMDYEFQGYVRTDSTGYHPKVGINQGGWTPPERPGDYSCTSGEAPAMLCYKEGFKSEYLIPDSTVWSGDINNPAYAWTPVTVTAEALSTTITVWTNVAPEGGSQSTYWDYMSLYQVPRQTPLAPNGLVLVPDLSLNPTVVTGTTTAQIQWTTSQPAFSQVFYRLHSTSTVSITSSLTPTVYLPFVVRSGYVSVDDFAYHTEPTSAMATSHSFSLSGLEAGQTYDYMVALRGFNGSTCVTTGSMIGTFTTP
jgi:hypothetical protein